MKVVGVRRAQAGNLPPGLGEHRGVAAVRVHDAADGLEGAIQDQMGRRVAGGFQIALDHAAVQVDDDHALRLKFVVGHAAGLDDDKALLAVDAAGIAPGERHQAGLHQVAVGRRRPAVSTLSTSARLPPARSRMAIRSFMTPASGSLAAVPKASCSVR